MRTDGRINCITRMAPVEHNFIFEGMEVGIFQELPRAPGRFRYEPYRGPGHYEMRRRLRLGEKPRCYFILSILLNDGDGRFTKQQGPPIDVGWPAWKVVAVDVNGDKNIDLVATTVDTKAPFASKVVVLLGDGHGKFTPAPGLPFAVGAGAYSIAVGDVNEDGKLDIAASSFDSGGVTLLLQR